MNRRTWIAAALAVTALNGVSMSATAQQGRGSGVEAAADVGQYGALATVAVSPRDVWIVGHQKQAEQPRGTFATHWDGSAWSTVPTPDLGDRYNDLSAVSATASNDVWAVGEYRSVGSQDRALAEHWDGMTWTSTPMPQPPDNDRVALRSVVAITPNDVWAVGSTSGKEHRTLADHWDGQSWTSVGGFPAQTLLAGIDGTSPNDVWTVGSTADNRPYTAHWNGAEWSTIPTPGPRNAQAALHAVTTVSANDAWAVGSVFGGSDRPYLLHWDGSRWTPFKPGRLETTWADLFGVSAAATDDVWAVGQTISTRGTEKTLIEHWDGTGWSVVPSPSPLQRSQLLSVSSLSRNDAWATGNDNFWDIIALHWDGDHWTTG